MRTDDAIALWGSTINSSIWMTRGDAAGICMGAVWLLSAAVICIAARRATPTPGG
jgi:hypothetical protein